MQDLRSRASRSVHFPAMRSENETHEPSTDAPNGAPSAIGRFSR